MLSRWQWDLQEEGGGSLSIKWIIPSYIQRIMGPSNVFQVCYQKTNYRLLWLAKDIKIQHSIFSLTLSGFPCSHQRDSKLWNPLCSLGFTVDACAAVLQDYCRTAAVCTKTNLGLCKLQTFAWNKSFFYSFIPNRRRRTCSNFLLTVSICIFCATFAFPMYPSCHTLTVQLCGEPSATSSWK